LSANDVTHRSQGHTTDPAIEAIIGDHAGWAGGLMPALHAVQHHAGFIDRGYIPLLAHTFNLSVAEVHGVISFYKDFRTVAPKGPVVQVCRAEACIARGGKAVEARALELGATKLSRSRRSSASGCVRRARRWPAAAELFGNVDAAGVETIIGTRSVAPRGTPS
jgi:hypothetical protein